MLSELTIAPTTTPAVPISNLSYPGFPKPRDDNGASLPGIGSVGINHLSSDDVLFGISQPVAQTHYRRIAFTFEGIPQPASTALHARQVPSNPSNSAWDQTLADVINFQRPRRD
ncbi:hypothetical protein RSOLAG1IB_05162 [Rhizoctonia solani AG-1 IB]|uniref:Uncharacterized protein n=1 Tax=Thanatephorus cucumeris (strain AG1-IB / isolate 7/3/14) TaxID=1108050 RepID=A0A0B7G3V2_THACB|nr:hypothetical protein RSOLAG1IB_05162 [Rhizoctonia solani AG-1 IB]